MRSFLSLVMLLVCTSTFAQPCTPNLVAHWDFNNGNLNDVARGRIAGVNGSPYAVAGRSGIANTAVKFNSGDYIWLPADTAYNLTSWTIWALVRADSFYSGQCETNSVLWHGAQFGTDHYHLIYYDNPYDSQCGIYTPSKEVFGADATGHRAPGVNWTYLGNTSQPNPFIATGQWYCVVAMYDADSQYVNMYVDGVHVLNNAPFINNYNYTGISPLFVGTTDASISANFPYFFNGALDDLKLYDGVFRCLDSFYCKSDTVVRDSVPSTAVPSLRNEDVVIYPNPATSVVNVRVPGSMYSGSVFIYSMTGALVKEIKISSDITQIDVAGLPSGVYIIKGSIGQLSITRRITITK